jgi:DNA-binding NarL/FixJ family response regulator
MSTNGKHIRVLIADDRPIVLEGLSSLLSKQPDIEVVAQQHDASDIIHNVESFSPDVVFLDIVPSASEAIQTITSLVAKQPNLRIVVFTNSLSEEHIYATLQAGAKGYLHKTSSLDDIVNCVRVVAADQPCIPPNIAQILARRRASPPLTRREQDVLVAMATGKSNKQIGLALQLSEGTVKVHVTHILEKLNVGGRTEALAAAAARGLVSLEFAPMVSTVPYTA